jgi:hypothetical protein
MNSIIDFTGGTQFEKDKINKLHVFQISEQQN